MTVKNHSFTNDTLATWAVEIRDTIFSAWDLMLRIKLFQI